MQQNYFVQLDMKITIKHWQIFKIPSSEKYSLVTNPSHQLGRGRVGRGGGRGGCQHQYHVPGSPDKKMVPKLWYKIISTMVRKVCMSFIHTRQINILYAMHTLLVQHVCILRQHAWTFFFSNKALVHVGYCVLWMITL